MEDKKDEKRDDQSETAEKLSTPSGSEEQVTVKRNQEKRRPLLQKVESSITHKSHAGILRSQPIDSDESFVTYFDDKKSRKQETLKASFSNPVSHVRQYSSADQFNRRTIRIAEQAVNKPSVDSSVASCPSEEIQLSDYSATYYDIPGLVKYPSAYNLIRIDSKAMKQKDYMIDIRSSKSMSQINILVGPKTVVGDFGDCMKLFYIVMSSLVYLSMLVIGSSYAESCPVNRNIPYNLIIQGIIGLTRTVFANLKIGLSVLIAIVLDIILFLSLTFSLTTILLEYHPHYAVKGSRYCDHVLYNYAVFITISVLGFVMTQFIYHCIMWSKGTPNIKIDSAPYRRLI